MKRRIPIDSLLKAPDAIVLSFTQTDYNVFIIILIKGTIKPTAVPIIELFTINQKGQVLYLAFF
ncbi:hypothetical protein COJ85_27845 [Bacillus sp. AFS076308]|nr:hypothetical protein COJ85_27845 [Bacillus sp. AFS076308]PGV49472.1 hypothetical protein COD92_21880 [Bacillus sp. AFS037270]